MRVSPQQSRVAQNWQEILDSENDSSSLLRSGPRYRHRLVLAFMRSGPRYRHRLVLAFMLAFMLTFMLAIFLIIFI